MLKVQPLQHAQLQLISVSVNGGHARRIFDTIFYSWHCAWHAQTGRPERCCNRCSEVPLLQPG